MTSLARSRAPLEISDDAAIARVLRGEHDTFAVLMRRYNQRLFRLVRSIVRPDAAAEDALQEAYLTAFTRLGTFEGRASFATWMARIAIRTATDHRTRARRRGEVCDGATAEEPVDAARSSPELAANAAEVRRILERAIDALPELYRGVVMLRLVEGLSTAETADTLGISDESVRVRLHRGRHELKRSLASRLDGDLASAFSFDGARCDRLIARVTARLPEPDAPPSPNSPSG